MRFDRNKLVLGLAAPILAIVTAVIGVARSLGLSTVGEGVETEAQRDHLRALGCELGQGYLFDRALSRDALFATYG